MIQRVQSVFLALLFIAMLLTHFFNFAAFTVGSVIFNFDIYYLFKFTTSEDAKISNHLYLAVCSVLIQMIALVTIFLFKKRTLQIKLCQLNFLLITAFIAISFLVFGNYNDIAHSYAKTVAATDVVIKYKVALLLPFVALILNFLALRFIKKDDNLIKSADRIR